MSQSNDPCDAAIQALRDAIRSHRFPPKGVLVSHDLAGCIKAKFGHVDYLKRVDYEPDGKAWTFIAIDGALMTEVDLDGYEYRLPRNE